MCISRFVTMFSGFYMEFGPLFLDLYICMRNGLKCCWLMRALVTLWREKSFQKISTSTCAQSSTALNWRTPSTKPTSRVKVSGVVRTTDHPMLLWFPIAISASRSRALFVFKWNLHCFAFSENLTGLELEDSRGHGASGKATKELNLLSPLATLGRQHTIATRHSCQAVRISGRQKVTAQL
ncbi:hypothetical protein RHMOL_Rhmol06G0271200 [Rhododendron molle]|uniref:Uncharacterized protein n=1 Tax=Rhododendron molle TaxID=49168 RepID=A0ACC0NIC6_RHOML|nr:hypothetical protein RHMOL_Rhmol06G0271200 [Rhododendron molle]